MKLGKHFGDRCGFCGAPHADLEFRWAKAISDAQLAEYEEGQDLAHAREPDLEMLHARAGVDPYAPEAPAEVVEPETVDAAVWEDLTAA